MHLRQCPRLLSYDHHARNLFVQVTCYFQGSTFSNMGFWGSKVMNSFRAAFIWLFAASSHQKDRIRDGLNSKAFASMASAAVKQTPSDPYL